MDWADALEIGELYPGVWAIWHRPTKTSTYGWRIDDRTFWDRRTAEYEAALWWDLKGKDNGQDPA